jgi:hypothetical protein
MKIIFTDHPFDTFAIALYQDEVVKAALDHLQTHPTLNINLLLYSIWYGRNQRGRLHKQEMKILLQEIHAWHEQIILVLQGLYHCITQHKKTNIALIREAIHKEMAIAERIERRLIADSLMQSSYLRRNPTQQLSDACYNITHYCLTSHVHLDEMAKKAITTLLQSAFPNLIAAEITDICENSLSNKINAQLSFDTATETLRKY